MLDVQQKSTQIQTPIPARRLPLLFDLRFLLPLCLALIAGVLAYQAPATADVHIGQFGDRLFLSASQGLGAAQADTWYGDELTDTPGERNRWTRQVAPVTFPALGAVGEVQLQVRLRGWPDNVLNQRTRQPIVFFNVNGERVGSVTPENTWTTATFVVPASLAAQSSDLRLVISTSDVFTSTRSYVDPRPKGVRVEYIGVRSTDLGLFRWPAWVPLAWLTLSSVLMFQIGLRVFRQRTPAFVLTTFLIGGAALGLALVRSWVAAGLPVLTFLLFGLLLIVDYRRVLGFLRQLVLRYGRGEALNYGLVLAGIAWLVVSLSYLGRLIPIPSFQFFRDTFPDSLLYGLLGAGVLLLAIVTGREGLPRMCHGIVRAFSGRWTGAIVLIVVLVLWLGSLAQFNASVSYVGHADYSDNAVVARNLLEGRGWVVDYVTQFYRLYDTVTRTQETWPLLQPVWIVPFYALFGVNAFAAKIPNLIFLTILGIAIYAVGARIWDRRVGLVAAIFVITSHLFFKLGIYVTNDLGFTVFAFGAIVLLYRWVIERDETSVNSAQAGKSRRSGSWRLVAAAVLTGLMMVQKPGTGVLVAFGMGLWFIWERWNQVVRRREPPKGWWVQTRTVLGPVAVWTTLALIVLSPYLVRNVVTFGALFYSTESKDAWVLGYTEWEAIYSIYTREANLSETDGLPDRSWVLRWGFDRTLAKFERQVDAVRDYLLPEWQRLPFGIHEWVSGNDERALLFGIGAWLSLFGVLGALRSRHRLMALLALAFGPYTLFLLTYWRADEERYFVIVMPWVALLAAYALWRIYDRIAVIGDGRWTPVGLLVVVVSFLGVVSPSWPVITQKMQVEPQLLATDIAAYTWLRDNVPAGEVVMTRLPWQVNWHTEHPTLMIPNTTDPDRLLRLARHYQVRYLIMDTMQRPEPATQKMLERMVADPELGFTQIYRTPDGASSIGSAVIYRFPDDYGGAAALR
jgi:hypothetical protein